MHSIGNQILVLKKAERRHWGWKKNRAELDFTFNLHFFYFFLIFFEHLTLNIEHLTLNIEHLTLNVECSIPCDSPGTNESREKASKSSWESQDFGDVNIGLKLAFFTSAPGANELRKEYGWGGGCFFTYTCIISQIMMINDVFGDFYQNHLPPINPLIPRAAYMRQQCVISKLYHFHYLRMSSHSIFRDFLKVDTHILWNNH